MKKIYIKKMVFVFIIMNFFLILINPFNIYNTVRGAYSDPYYICDFSEYPNGLGWINQSDEGITWLKVEPSNGIPEVTNGWYYIVKAFDTSASAYFNLTSTRTTNNMNYTLLGASSNNAQWLLNQSFYDINGNLLFYMHTKDQGGTLWFQFYLYRNNGTLVDSDTGQRTGRFDINITVNLTTDYVFLEVRNTTVSSWFHINGLESISDVSFVVTDTVYSTRTICLTDYKVILSDDTPNEDDLYVYVVPVLDQYYIGQYVNVYSNVPEEYENQFYITITDDGDPARKIYFYDYPQQGVYLPVDKGLTKHRVLLPRKSPYGDNYVTGEWIVRVADYDLYAPQQPYENVASKNINVTLGDNAIITNDKFTYILGNDITYKVYGESNTNYNVILRDLNNVYYANQTIKTDGNGYYAGGILSTNCSWYRLWLYLSSDGSYENESETFSVKEWEDINRYSSNCKDKYYNDSLIEFRCFRLTGNDVWWIEILNPNGEVVFSSRNGGDSSLVSFRHIQYIMGLGWYHLYIYTEGDSRNSGYHKLFQIVEYSYNNINFIVGLGLSLGAGVGVAVITEMPILMPFVAGVVAISLTQFRVDGDPILPTDYVVYILVLLALMVILLWFLS